MTLYCHVSNGLVDNRAVFDGDMPEDWPDRENWIANDDAQIGWAYADGAFSAPPPPPPEPPVIPDRVTSRQFKLQLLSAGLLDQVEAWVAAQDQAVQIAYANSGTFLRTEPMMQTGFTALGFTTDQIDAFYVAAAAL